MKTLTKDEARVGSMTAEEAGVATYDRALQLQGSLAALLSRQSAAISDWQKILNEMEATRPWMHLPKEKPVKDFYKWLGSTFKVGSKPLDRDQLVAIVDAYAPERGLPIVSAFEKAIETPYFPKLGTKGGGNGNNQHSNRNPDNGCSQRSDRQRGTSADYLMARLIAEVGAEVVEQIGPGRQFESVMAAAVHYGIAKRRVRYEVTPDAKPINVAGKLIEVLGPEGAAAVAAAITHQLTEQ
jgi:hypothetical protein